MVRSRRRGGRNQEIIVDGITAKINNRILNSGEKILEDGSLRETLDKAVEGKPIIYTLYKNDDLYYVGQSDTGSLGRVWNHTRDKHRGKWNKFGVYRIRNKRYLDDLEAILIRVTKPKGNSSKGGFADCDNLTDDVKSQFIEKFEMHRNHLEKQLKGLEGEFKDKQKHFDNEEEKITKYYRKRIGPLEGRDGPRVKERRIMLKREKKEEFRQFEKRKNKKMNPLEKEITIKRDNVFRLDKLISSTKKLG